MTGRQNPSAARALAGPAIAVTLVFAALVGLGVWQLQRLAWKEQIIARIDARTHQAPEFLPPLAQWPTLQADDYDYRHVRAFGRYLPNADVLIFRSSAPSKTDANVGPGYQVLTPFKLGRGGIVLVDRGFAPLAWKDDPDLRPPLPESEIELAGLMRPPEDRNLFTPADEPDKGIWFTRDPAAMAAKLDLAAAAPFVIDLDAAPTAKGWPHAGATELNIPNNHLSYAWIWFGLAATLLGVFGVWAWGKTRSS
jgi:surfeit locus 1 family protein